VGAIDKGWGKCRTGGLLVADLAEAQDYAELSSAGSTRKAKAHAGNDCRQHTDNQVDKRAAATEWYEFVSASLQARQRSGR
jgi:hypothetical protein